MIAHDAHGLAGGDPQRRQPEPFGKPANNALRRFSGWMIRAERPSAQAEAETSIASDLIS
jgi:hypothetical protein